MPTFWLSMHVSYACRHSGACCSSGWPIPVERSRLAPLRVLRPDGEWLRPARDAPHEIAGVLATRPDGRCVFRQEGCEIQRAFGHDAIPSACQHFPREVLLDPRGVFVTLSHYCPTAASLLAEHTGPVEIVEGPPAIPGGEPEGLDARDVLPPLLTHRVLMDHEGYFAWERHMVRELTTPDRRTPEQVLDHLERDLAIIQQWRPGGPALSAFIAELPREEYAKCEIRPDPISSNPISIIRRHLAARAFASWMAYQGGGAAAVLRHLRMTLSALYRNCQRLGAAPGDTAALIEAVRQTDLQMLHLADRDELIQEVRSGTAV